ncbi:thioesterase II family protein [Actinophytocola oryzae]|uniref:Surfactin synthase thioesterase subunit n=1 Tax=Actinophytocola oryzae TaxID=502181 RepID=A0A4R7VZY4_9PSEU|nr:alpha/beta fold hydrolase [Actinophytocola oryzae]TDV54827.1 surfactin synthase thioesterase subunit [Actinophytocola oryzae]
MTATVPTTTPYLDRPPFDDDRPRLFCFHHAGGGASAFAGWRNALAKHLDVFPVQLPGREGRVAEPAVRDIDALVADLDEHLGPFLRQPFLFYGHSMGALVAYRLTHYRVRTGQSTPDALVVGGYPPPDQDPPMRDDSAELNAVLGELTGRLGRFPRWVDAAKALLSDDIALVESHEPVKRPPLPVPIHMLTGTHDPLMTPTDALGWARHTSAHCRVHIVPGGHLFTRDSPAIVHALVVAAAHNHRVTGEKLRGLRA